MAWQDQLRLQEWEGWGDQRAQVSLGPNMCLNVTVCMDISNQCQVGTNKKSW